MASNAARVRDPESAGRSLPSPAESSEEDFDESPIREDSDVPSGGYQEDLPYHGSSQKRSFDDSFDDEHEKKMLKFSRQGFDDSCATDADNGPVCPAKKFRTAVDGLPSPSGPFPVLEEASRQVSEASSASEGLLERIQSSGSTTPSAQDSTQSMWRQRSKTGEGSPKRLHALGIEDDSRASAESRCLAYLKAPRPKARIIFSDIFPEVRARIYRWVFRSSKPVDFVDDIDNIRRTASLLVTCRSVYREGCRVLYGENCFSIKREWGTRGEYYEAWEEVGYGDAELFLSSIGPKNLALIPEFHLRFEDGCSPSYSLDADQQTFADDISLISCLQLLSRHGRPRKLVLEFSSGIRFRLLDDIIMSQLRAIGRTAVIEIGPALHITDGPKDELVRTLLRNAPRLPLGGPDLEPGRPKSYEFNAAPSAYDWMIV